MPQDIHFDVPFPSLISPDAAAARERNHVWARAHGLVGSELAAQRYLSNDIAGLMARWIPGAVGPDLDLTIDGVIVATLLDDQIDSDLADQPEEVAKICQAMVSVMRPDAAAPRSASKPLINAFADVWGRLTQGRTAAFCARTARHWQWYLDAYVDEAKNRNRGIMPTRAEHFELRRRSGFVYAMMDMTERAYNFETPERAWHTRQIQTMLTITADVVDTLNDIHSLEKEEARGDLHNFVLVVQHERRCSRAEAIAETRDGIHEWIANFIKLTEEIPELCVSLDLTEPERDNVRQLVTGMKTAMRGYFDWSCKTDRYATTNLVRAGQAAYPHDLL
ncbi:hypothetical protein WMF38_48595 [Sorangium sp. So ce118]